MAPEAPEEWPQRTIQFTDWYEAEAVAVEHLLPLFTVQNSDTQWSFLRKHPRWRLRFWPADPDVSRNVDRSLDELLGTSVIAAWAPGIYEPETTAFGGPAAMQIAHKFFHHDSRRVLDHIARRRTADPDTPDLGRRELAVLLLSVAMRAARLDRYEQGDVWAKLAALRSNGEVTPTPTRLTGTIHRLMTIDASSHNRLFAQGRLAHLRPWITTFEWLGRQLADLNHSGGLERGLRAVLAHHAIFHLNRMGLPAQDQLTLSALAKEAVMATNDTTASTPTGPTPGTTVDGVNSDTIEATPDGPLRNQLIDQLISKGSVRSARVEEAMRTVPRHLFVPDAPLEKAYGNAPVNTKLDDSGASISCASQPDIVGMMLEQMEVAPGQNVLELGAGTGFNAGLLGHLVGEQGHVTTIDVDDDIVDGARSGLKAAGISNVEVILGDGAVGYAKNAPYDHIVATVGAHGVPHAWLDQLAPGGRLLTPLRLRGSVSRSIAFELKDNVWRSVGSEMNTFMPLARHRGRPAHVRPARSRQRRHARHERGPGGRRGRADRRPAPAPDHCVERRELPGPGVGGVAGAVADLRHAERPQPDARQERGHRQRPPHRPVPQLHRGLRRRHPHLPHPPPGGREGPGRRDALRVRRHRPWPRRRVTR
nr:methyltransferase, FxLD system [Streptomyces boluensis]